MEIKVEDFKNYVGKPVCYRTKRSIIDPTLVDEWLIIKSVTYAKDKVTVLFTDDSDMTISRNTRHTELLVSV